MGKIIVLTGKTGVGKTYLLQKINFSNTIYLDNYIKNNFYIKDHPLFNEITNCFGNEIVNDNHIDTTKLGKIIFSDKGIEKQYLDQLNKMVAPYVIELLKKLKAENNLTIIEMAIYINLEHIYKKYIDYVILMKNDNPILDDKFLYLKKQVEPIKNYKIKADISIDQENGEKEIKKILGMT